MLPKLIVSLPTLLVILCLSAGVPAADLEWRTWTDATGQVPRSRGVCGTQRRPGVVEESGRLHGWRAPRPAQRGGSRLGRSGDGAIGDDSGIWSRPPTEWLTFRGPNRDGKSPDTGLLKEWPEDGPKLLWKVTDIGKGWSGVAVADGTVYITGDVDDKLMLFAFDLDYKCIFDGDGCAFFDYTKPGATGQSPEAIRSTKHQLTAETSTVTIQQGSSAAAVSPRRLTKA